MKHFFSHVMCIAIIFGAVSCTQPTSSSETEASPEKEISSAYQISGKVTPYDGSEIKITLFKFNPVTQVTEQIAQSTTNESGTFELSYVFESPSLFRLKVNKQKTMLAIDRGQNKISITSDGLRKGVFSMNGSKDSQLLLDYTKFRIDSYTKWVLPTYNAMDSATIKGDEQGEIDAVNQYAKNSKVHRLELLDFANKKLDSSLALYGTMLRWTGDEGISLIEQIIAKFSHKYPNTEALFQMQDKLNRFKKVQIGTIVSDFTVPDSSGTQIRLSEIQSEIILIDFWASWCGPCILQIPDLRVAYDSFHNRGLEIIGISVDNKRESWIKALNQHKMNWPNVSDLKEWDSEIVANFNVTFVPFNILLDKNGVILAKNLHSTDLLKKLEELLPEKI